MSLFAVSALMMRPQRADGEEQGAGKILSSRCLSHVPAGENVPGPVPAKRGMVLPIWLETNRSCGWAWAVGAAAKTTDPARATRAGRLREEGMVRGAFL